MILKLLLNRNFILITALVLGFVYSDFTDFTQDYVFYIMALTISLSMTSVKTNSLFPLKDNIKPLIAGVILNYLIYGLVIIILLQFFEFTDNIYYGFIVIAATPPGAAIIPFTSILGGNVKYAIIGTLGAFISSIFITPIIIETFSSNAGSVDSIDLIFLMLKLIVFPVLVSRVLIHPRLEPITKNVRGRIIDFGFAIIIYTAIGLNRDVFFSDFSLLLKIGFVVFCSIFILGFVHKIFSNFIKLDSRVSIAQNLLLTIKSSGFSVVCALSLFGKEAAIPSAVLSVVVLIYLLYMNFMNRNQN
ncbi:MAG: bile acid:sodium symporter [Marinifilaceae bacterium]|jgi:BASS family bile acid:Na+ symporter|nr:bile acid:sodium symporter [Marinifilaceae bacterium]